MHTWIQVNIAAVHDEQLQLHSDRYQVLPHR